MGDQTKKQSRDAEPPAGFIEKRREPRYDIPEVYREYITLRVKTDGAFVPAALGSFSRHGVMFECPASFAPEALIDCVLSISESFSKDVAFSIRVKSCTKKNALFVVRAVIETVADAVWFDVFLEVHDFIIQRQGIVY